ncbi:uncharacterized protein LOC111316412 [Durio zibethinus]|uniref:Uncharacterized protein LOC111316412 n=1 Tax=Durio zibethinus TaxID=66656 RepID=A0A6P6BAI5_DURZI|nr:uncharacterized protein LOC111316412 [Durio zibethinus]
MPLLRRRRNGGSPICFLSLVLDNLEQVLWAKLYFLGYSGIFKSSISILESSFFIWSLWLARNEKVFNQKVLSTDELFNLICIRLHWWLKAKFPQAVCNSIDVGTNLHNISIPRKMKAVKKHIIWTPPPLGAWKINVDGSAIGKRGPTGIGGVVENHKGQILLLFSKHIGIQDSNFAELLAVVEALSIIVSPNIDHIPEIIVESDSLIVTS